MQIRDGYKRTEVGVIPEDWKVAKLADEVRLLSGQHVLAQYCNTVGEGTPYLTGPADFPEGVICHSKFTDRPTTLCREGDVLVTVKGSGVGSLTRADGIYCISRQLMAVRPKSSASSDFIFWCLARQTAKLGSGATGLIPGLSRSDLLDLEIPLPPLPEQKAIAAALSDIDALLNAQEAAIAKKRDLKTAAMQQLLTAKRRLSTFSGDWEMKNLEECTDCLDNLRIPLNESQRLHMKGAFPYCGANGVVDFIDRFMIDDDIILMAEDGGYFDEYEYRPIAYRMVGKCWVNNHAHILKPKPGFDQGFIFYCLVHKNIMRFLASGTRAKLNKSLSL